MIDNLNFLKSLKFALHKIDEDMRMKATCPRCGKPTSGIVYNSQTKETAGLCTCEPIEEATDDSAQS